MPSLRSLLQANPETAQDFEAAAENRYWEGAELAAADRPYGAIYLLGYVAEIYLKLAALRIDGLTTADPVKPRLVPAKHWMKAFVPTVDAESFHSLLFWASLLRAKRNYLGRPLDLAIDAVLTQRVRRIYRIWWIEMRYRHAAVDIRQLQNVYNDVSWIRFNYSRLWR